jgi:hypothetical protein
MELICHMCEDVGVARDLVHNHGLLAWVRSQVHRWDSSAEVVGSSVDDILRLTEICVRALSSAAAGTTKQAPGAAGLVAALVRRSAVWWESKRGRKDTMARRLSCLLAAVGHAHPAGCTPGSSLGLTECATLIQGFHACFPASDQDEAPAARQRAEIALSALVPRVDLVGACAGAAVTPQPTAVGVVRYALESAVSSCKRELGDDAALQIVVTLEWLCNSIAGSARVAAMVGEDEGVLSALRAAGEVAFMLRGSPGATAVRVWAKCLFNLSGSISVNTPLQAGITAHTHVLSVLDTTTSDDPDRHRVIAAALLLHLMWQGSSPSAAAAATTQWLEAVDPEARKRESSNTDMPQSNGGGKRRKKSAKKSQ